MFFELNTHALVKDKNGSVICWYPTMKEAMDKHSGQDVDFVYTPFKYHKKWDKWWVCEPDFQDTLPK